MKPIKTVKEGLLLVLFIIVGIFTFDLVLQSNTGRILSSYSEFDFLALKWKITALISSAIGTYYYIIKNFWINFKSKSVLVLLIVVSLVLTYSATSLYISTMELKTVIESNFNTISFPIETDFVTKNIKLTIAKHTSYLLISALITGFFALITGNIFLLLHSKRFPK